MADAFDDAYVQYLLGQMQGPNIPSYDEDLLKDQGTWMTQASKGGNLSTDLDYLMSAGLLAPGAYDPVTSFDPVDAPGYRLIQQWKGGSDYEQYLASQFEMGKSANEILADLQRIVADPGDDPTAQAISASLPRYYAQDPLTNELTVTEQPDMRAVGDELRRYESTILSDPQYTIGPDGQPMMPTTEDSAARQAALEAGYVSTPGQGYDPYSFAPAGTYEEDQRILEARKQAAGSRVEGYTNQAIEFAKNKRTQDAYQSFLAALDNPTPAGARAGGPDRQGNPDIPERGGLADDAARFIDSPGEHLGNFLSRLPGRATQLPGIMDRTTENVAGALDRQFGDPIEEVGSGQRDIVLNGSYGSGNSWSLGIPDRLTGGGGAQPQGLTGANDGDRGWSGWSAGSRAQSALPTREAILNQVLGGMRAGARRAAGEAQGRNYQAHIARRQAEEADIAASDQLVLARRRQAARQALANQLLAQGRSPFQDEVNRRNQAIYGMGM
jgi:hypothetical protein